MTWIRSIIRNFSKGEFILWGTSVCMTVLSFLIFDRTNYLTLTASLIGVTSLIFNAKGNPIGQLLTVFFSVLYGIISFSFSYYGEMITYLGMKMCIRDRLCSPQGRYLQIFSAAGQEKLSLHQEEAKRIIKRFCLLPQSVKKRERSI